jgi:hypothetical protein
LKPMRDQTLRPPEPCGVSLPMKPSVNIPVDRLGRSRSRSSHRQRRSGSGRRSSRQAPHKYPRFTWVRRRTVRCATFVSNQARRDMRVTSYARNRFFERRRGTTIDHEAFAKPTILGAPAPDGTIRFADGGSARALE